MQKPMHAKLLLLVFLLLPSLAWGQARVWKNTNATRSFSGTLVKREPNQITIKMTNSGRNVVIKPEQLHPSDIDWLKKNHPFDHEKPKTAGPDMAPGSFYDTLAFGDDKPTVIKKLKASKRFNSELDETFFARTGLNGTFRTTKGNEFFGMSAALYYGWNDNHRLEFLSLYGHETAPAQVKAKLIPIWHQMVKDMSSYFGKAKSSSPTPQYANLGESEITFTHVWPMKAGGSMLLGVGKQDGKYVVVARFTRETH